jgi:hypothetical protein
MATSVKVKDGIFKTISSVLISYINPEVFNLGTLVNIAGTNNYEPIKKAIMPKLPMYLK